MTITTHALNRTRANRPASRTLESVALRAVDSADPPAAATVAMLNHRQARDLTEAIRSTTEVLHALLARAHGGRAWSALGYPSFEHYVKVEFSMSRSRAYQLLNQAAVIDAIEAALPEGASTPMVTEAAARDLKPVLDELITHIRAHLAEI